MRAALFTALLLAAAPAAAQTRARPGRWALGATLGDPFGLSLKRYAGSHAWDLYLALAYGPGVRLGGDWLWTLAYGRNSGFDLDVYAGVGPFVGSFRDPCGPGFISDRCNGDAYVGARVPFGVEILLRGAPLSFGLEVAPGLAIAPGRAGLLLDALLAIRFFL